MANDNYSIPPAPPGGFGRFIVKTASSNPVPEKKDSKYKLYADLNRALEEDGFNILERKNLLWNAAAESEGRLISEKGAGKGHGYFQITGPSIIEVHNEVNKRRNEKKLPRIDFIGNPKLANDPKYATELAVAWARINRKKIKEGFSTPESTLQTFAPKKYIDLVSQYRIDKNENPMNYIDITPEKRAAMELWQERKGKVEKSGFGEPGMNDLASGFLEESVASAINKISENKPAMALISDLGKNLGASRQPPLWNPKKK